jgi:galactokinase
MRDVSREMFEDHESGLDVEIASRARHVLGENERVAAAAGFLERGDAAAFGRLLNRSHESSRLNFENSTESLDTIVAAARTVNGVYGARLTGAGFGGAVIAVLKPESASDFVKTMLKEAPAGLSDAFIIKPSDGATIIG